MPLRYTVTLANTAQVVGTDFFSLTAAATRSIRIVEINYAGNGTASAANVMKVSRFATAPTGAPTGAITPRPMNPAAPAAAFLAQTAFATTQPTGTESIVMQFSANANGGVFRWVAPPYGEIELPGGAQAVALANISFRPGVGTSTMTLNVVVDEF